MERLKEKLTVQNIIIAYIILQPIIDILTSMGIEYFKTNITLGIIIRTIFMIFCVILAMIKADKKYRIVMSVYYGILVIYGASFLINSYIQNGTNLIFIQMRGLVKNFYLPVIIVALYPVFRTYKIEINRKVLITTLMLYVFIIFICSMAGIAFPTYKAGGKAGTVGLFYAANEIGAILCLLSPFLIVDFMNRKLKAVDIISFVLLVYSILQVGTQVPYFGLIILIGMIIFACLIYAKLRKNRIFYKKAGMFLGVLVAIYLVTGITPVGENLSKNYGNIFPITTEDIRFKNQKEPPKITEITNFEELKTMVVSSRTDYLNTNKEKFVNGNLVDKILGISFVEKENGETKELKLAEMDYFDILLCNGIVGAVLFIIPILSLIITLIRYSIVNQKKVGLEQIYVVIMSSVVAMLAGHVLVSPAVSIYIAVVLISYDSEVRKTQNKKELLEEGKNEENNNTSPTFVGRGN